MLTALNHWLRSLWLWRRQVARFLLIGAVNFGLDFSVYYILTRWFNWYYLVANVGSFLVANISSYLMNSQWTFAGATGRSWGQYGQYLIISAGYIGLIEIGMWLLVSILVWPDLLAKFLVNGAMAAVYFTVLQLSVFKRQS